MALGAIDCLAGHAAMKQRMPRRVWLPETGWRQRFGPWRLSKELKIHESEVLDSPNLCRGFVALVALVVVAAQSHTAYHNFVLKSIKIPKMKRERMAPSFSQMALILRPFQSSSS